MKIEYLKDNKHAYSLRDYGRFIGSIMFGLYGRLHLTYDFYCKIYITADKEEIFFYAIPRFKETKHKRTIWKRKTIRGLIKAVTLYEQRRK